MSSLYYKSNYNKQLDKCPPQKTLTFTETVIYRPGDELQVESKRVTSQKCPGPSTRFDRCTFEGEHCHCYLSSPMHRFESKLILRPLREMTLNIISQILVHVNVMQIYQLYSQVPHNLYKEILMRLQVLSRGNCTCALNRK